MLHASRIRRKNSILRRGRRGFVFAATAWFAIVTTGVPLPAGAAIDLAGGPFPCQSHACGCRSAAACWADCCCFSQEEKLAWAKANGVTPPAGTPLYDPAARSSKAKGEAPATDGSCCREADDDSPARDAVRSCCAAKIDRATCCGANTDKATCCSAKTEPATCCEKMSSDEGDRDDSPRSASIAVLDAMKCRGVATTWIGTGQPFVAPAAIEWSPDTALSEALPATTRFVACCRPGYVGPPG